MTVKLFESELKVMRILWKEGKLPATQVVKLLHDEIGWNKNTTYTVIKKCIEKKVVSRSDPGFLCEALITKEDIQKYETQELVDKMFNGSKGEFFSSFVNSVELTESEIEELEQLITKLKR